MGTALVMYVLPMLLGQTYDLGTESPGFQIFPSDVRDKTTKIERYFTDSQYRMVENAEEVRDFLSIGGKLALKIKGGMVDVAAEGSYLKDSGSKTNGIEILVKVHFETITETIPWSVKPNKGWMQLDKKMLGTHYCRSITYGGDLVASVRITADNSFDLMRVKGAISGDIKGSGGSFEASVKGKLELLQQNAQDSSSMEINYYASVPIYGVSHSVEGLLQLVEDFPDHVMKVNNGKGSPLRMELHPLSALDSLWPAYFENQALTDELSDLDAQFDDLRDTRKNLAVWMSALPPIIPPDVNEKIEKFTDKVNKIYGQYLQSISDLNVTVGASMKPFTDAFEAYEAGEYTIPYKYTRQLIEVQKDIYESHPELKPRIGGSHYFRWGRSECPSNGTDPSTVGVMSSSEILQNGGSTNFLCAPFDPTEVDPKDYFKNYIKSPLELLISPLRYNGNMKRFNHMKEEQIACVHCRAAHRTTVLVKMADTKCPTDKWTKEYDGIMMAPGRNDGKHDYICMDKDMEKAMSMAQFGNPDRAHWSAIQEVTVECGSLPCSTYPNDKPIPCVVCTI